jgi:hypothetical protein
MKLDETLAALDHLRADAEKLHAALLKHEQKLAVGHQNNPDLAELYGFIHRMRCVTADTKAALSEPAPAR